jgi:hypothetical protein
VVVYAGFAGSYDETRWQGAGPLKKPFGGDDSDPAAPRSGRPRTDAPQARRPARPRSSAKSDPGAAPAARSRLPSAGFEPLGNAPPAAAEVACPNCGEPMLAGWGTTCGKCRPNLVSPKTMFLAAGQVALPAQAAGGMTLGWLVVLTSADESQRGALIEVERDTLVLSRAGAPQNPVEQLVPFDDGFMSIGHAVLNRPVTGERTDAFTIHDRKNPGPSVNGTFVNARKLTPGEVVRLGDGDIIKVGTAELLFKSLWLPPVADRRS